MSVPTFDKFIEPVLRYLAANPDGAPARDVHEAAAAALHLSETDRAELLPSGAQSIYKNRAGWAHDRLKRAGYSTSPRRGFWKLSPEGRAFAAKNKAPLSTSILGHIAEINTDVQLKTCHRRIRLPQPRCRYPIQQRLAQTIVWRALLQSFETR